MVAYSMSTSGQMQVISNTASIPDNEIKNLIQKKKLNVVDRY